MAKSSGEKIISTNSSAYANFFIDEVVEAGLVLQGTEAKSLRLQAPNIKDAFVEVRDKNGKLEAWLLNAHIAPYSHGNIWNHEPTRARKLLLHSHQILRLHGALTQKGLTIVPLKMYFKNGRAKIEIGLGRGKKKYDKRQDIKARDAERDMAIARSAKNVSRRSGRGNDYDD